MRMMYVAERAVVVVMMVSVAVTPVPIMCPTAVSVPPTRPVTPVPRTMPCVPTRTPEPIVDNRPENVDRLYHVVRSIDILIADYLNGNLVLLVFLYIYRGYVLEDILRENSLQHDKTLVAFARLHYA